MSGDRGAAPGRQLVHTAAGMIAFQFMNVLAGWWVARTLGAEGQGRFQLVVAVSVFAAILGKLGLDEGIAYRIPILRRETPGRVGPVVAYGMLWSVAAAVVLAAVLTFFIGPLSSESRLPNFAVDLRWTWATIPALMVLQCALAALRGLERSDRRALAYYWGVGAAYLGLLAAFTAGGASLSGVFAARIGSYGVGLALAAIWIASGLREIRAAREPLAEERGRLHRFAGWLLFATWFRYVVEQPLVDLAWVGAVAGEAQAGIYSVAARLSSLTGLATAAVTIVAGPLYAGWLAARRDGEIHPTHEAAARAVAYGTTLGAGVLWWAPEWWLGWFGAEYTAGAPVLRWIAVGYAAASWAGPSSPWLLARGRARVEGTWTAIAALWMIAGGGWAAVRFGPVGVAIVTGSAVALLGWGLALTLSRLEAVRPWRWCGGPALALAVGAGAAALWPSTLPPSSRAAAFGVAFSIVAARPAVRDLRRILGARRASAEESR